MIFSLLLERHRRIALPAVNRFAGFVPHLSEAVRWLADLGGYTGPWNGPPGPTVVGRGLRTMLAAARAFENASKMR